MGIIARIVLGPVPAVADLLPGGFDLRIVGVMLMLGGVLAVSILLLRTRSRWSGSTVRSRQDAMDDLAGHNASRRGSHEPAPDADLRRPPGQSGATARRDG
ncbi:hypothetical protein ACNF49_40890 [Actinomadura sp. ATCC 39365]